MEPPGTAPGSERFITTPVYRHSRPLRDGTPNIGGRRLRRKAAIVPVRCQRSAARFDEGAGCPFPFSLALRRGNGAPGGASGLRGRSCPLRSGHFAHRGPAGFAKANGPIVGMGLRGPSRGARALQWQVCEASHPDAAPPGAPPADTAFAASAPKDLGPISGPSFGLSRAAPRVMTARGERARDGNVYIPMIGNSQEACLAAKSLAGSVRRAAGRAGA